MLKDGEKYGFRAFAPFLRGGEKFISISMGDYMGNRGFICPSEVRGWAGVAATGAEKEEVLRLQFVKINGF